MQVHIVGDDLERHTGVGCRGHNRSGIPVVQRGHRVERVREDRRTGVEGGPGRVETCIRVSDRGCRAARHDGADRVVPAGPFRRQGHLAHRAAPRREQPFDGGEAGVAEQREVVCALVPGVEERALQMRAEDLRVGGHDVRDHRHPALQGLQGGGDERDHRAGGAVRAVQRAGDLDGVRSVVVRGAAAAVPVQVDEARRQQGSRAGQCGAVDDGRGIRLRARPASRRRSPSRRPDRRRSAPTRRR